MSESKYESDPTATSSTVSCCSSSTSSVSAPLKLYQAFIFSVPIFFTFILLFFFYLFYLRRRRADWSSLRMRTASLATIHNNNINSTCELGLKKEVREMLPVIVFKQSFSVKDTQCSVCLGDYQAEDKLQQMPVCGHTFHMDCIDLWLATHTTCPLCRLSLLLSRASDDPRENQANDTDQSPESPDVENHDEGSQSSSQPIVDPQLQANETDRSPESTDVENHGGVLLGAFFSLLKTLN
ncbi:RING-H2 finger protein ATL7-like [Apium graveolens]|uniref:RING-H2 finger protein ATL7-like n=1 Tax=Apium graveolens TaxID=4045 RepID=UPI003D7B6F6C